jgi:bifunctional non-homologous end joining protein LigD
MPWSDRREILEMALPSNPLFHLSAAFDAAPATVINAVREFNLEGVIAKRRSSFYEPGKRSGRWIKHRVLTGQ